MTHQNIKIHYRATNDQHPFHIVHYFCNTYIQRCTLCRQCGEADNITEVYSYTVVALWQHCTSWLQLVRHRSMEMNIEIFWFSALLLKGLYVVKYGVKFNFIVKIIICTYHITQDLTWLGKCFFQRYFTEFVAIATLQCMVLRHFHNFGSISRFLW